MARFSYYKRLSRRQRAIYRRSDEVRDVPLRDLAQLKGHAAALRKALERDDRVEVEEAAARLVAELVRGLDVEPLAVRVLATRPRSASAELHGLYTREEGRRALLQVWMRTAAHGRVVAFRTFLRTLMHEVCHHLDYTLLGLEDSFHTEGFFRRESSLVRQLVGGRRRTSRPAVPSSRAPTPPVDSSPERSSRAAEPASPIVEERAAGRQRAERGEPRQMELPLPR